MKTAAWPSPILLVATLAPLELNVAARTYAQLRNDPSGWVSTPGNTREQAAFSGSGMFGLDEGRQLRRLSTHAAAQRPKAIATVSAMSMAGSLPGRQVLKESERKKSNEGADTFFYNLPRICYHVDQSFLTHLTDLYRERIPPGGAVLDMMSSWVSHLPPDVAYSRVDGQGMNLEELNRNPRLDTKRVWDLNAEPRLPFEDATYDAVICAVSVQYLQQPETVFADVRRVLKPGGVGIFSFSNRMFYDKAITGWINRSGRGRAKLVAEYFNAAGGFTSPEIVERAAQDGAGFFAGFADMFGMAGPGDPFFAVVATKDA